MTLCTGSCTDVLASTETQDALWIICWRTWSLGLTQICGVYAFPMLLSSKKNGDTTGNILKHFEAKLHKYITFLYKDLCIFILYCTGKKSEGRTYLPIHVSLDLLSSFLCSIRQLVNYQGVLVRCSQNALELKHQLLKKTIG